MKRYLSPFMVLLVLASATLATGCNAGGEPPESTGGLGSAANDQRQSQKLAYEDQMERMITALDDPEAPELQRSVNQGDRRQLAAAAQRWDAAIGMAEAATPPEEVAKTHAELVAAMKELSRWNHRIAKAAPNKTRTRRLAKKAQNSPAAKRYGKAIDDLQARGYTIGPPLQDEPLEFG